VRLRAGRGPARRRGGGLAGPAYRLEGHRPGWTGWWPGWTGWWPGRTGYAAQAGVWIG